MAAAAPALVYGLGLPAATGGADLGVAGAFSAGAVTASLGGAHVGRRVDASRLRWWFGVLVLSVAASVAASVILLDSTTIG